MSYPPPSAPMMYHPYPPSHYPPMMGPGMGPPMYPRPAALPQLPEPAKPKVERRDGAQKQTAGEVVPVTTVFVGQINEKAPDSLIKSMLQYCGTVISWKRVQGANGKLQKFGFCEYETPSATLRCLRLLNKWDLGGCELVVKVDPKTRSLLDEFLENGRRKSNGEQILCDADKREDLRVLEALRQLMMDFRVELERPDPKPAQEVAATVPTAATAVEKEEEPVAPKTDPKPAANSAQPATPYQVNDRLLDDMDRDEEEKKIIRNQIRNFRESHRKEDATETGERERDERSRRSDRRHDDQSQRRDKERRGDRERRRRHSRSRSDTRDRDSAAPAGGDTTDGERERSERDESGRHADQQDDESEEEYWERKRYERRMREKEVAYEERLAAWESRERKKRREYEKEEERERLRRDEMERERLRLREFLEDYNDLLHDTKYYRGAPFARRLKEREKELEADNRDSTREKEEIEEVRRRLIEEGKPSAEVEQTIQQLEKKRDEHLLSKLELVDMAVLGAGADHLLASSAKPETDHATPSEPPLAVGLSTSAQLLEPQDLSTATGLDKPDEPSQDYSSSSAAVDNDDDDDDDNNDTAFDVDDQDGAVSNQAPSFGLPAIRLGGPKSDAAGPGGGSTVRKRQTVAEVFNQDDEDDEVAQKRRKLLLEQQLSTSSVGDFNGASNAGASSSFVENELVSGPLYCRLLSEPIKRLPQSGEERKELMKRMIENIPTSKEELFAFDLDWEALDSNLMQRRLRPWVNKKIIEYIGEEEQQLTDFISSVRLSVAAHTAPNAILADIAAVLDEEAEVFVVKMWRVLVYETEAKKLGLSATGANAPVSAASSQ